jgi:hypothetical protein
MQALTNFRPVTIMNRIPILVVSWEEFMEVHARIAVGPFGGLFIYFIEPKTECRPYSFYFFSDSEVIRPNRYLADFP